LSNNQYGFRPAHSTSHALSFVNKAANAVDSNSYLAGSTLQLYYVNFKCIESPELLTNGLLVISWTENNLYS